MWKRDLIGIVRIVKKVELAWNNLDKTTAIRLNLIAPRFLAGLPRTSTSATSTLELHQHLFGHLLHRASPARMPSFGIHDQVAVLRACPIYSANTSTFQSHLIILATFRCSRRSKERLMLLPVGLDHLPNLLYQVLL
jgi:hypothetical protein